MLLGFGVMASADSIYTIFPYTGSIVQYTIPVSGVWLLQVVGASGGNAGSLPGAAEGGLGALIDSEFTLAQNQVLDVAVGGSGNVAGGGGGSFVVLQNGPNSYSPLVVAGGGGGGSGTAVGGDASLTNPNSSGGGAGAGYYAGGGGGGYLSNGVNAPVAYGGASFLNGLAGGTGADADEDGGFGGGGGANGGAGGGGGFSGGAGGSFDFSNESFSPSEGGGSYAGGSIIVSQLAQLPGNGEVVLILESPAPPSAPEPTSLGLLALGLLAIPACGLIRRVKIGSR